MEQKGLCKILLMITLFIKASTSSEEVEYIHIGDTAVLKCPFENVIRWIDLDKKQTYALDHEINPQLPNARRLNVTSRLELIIRNIEETDFKRYSCQSDNQQHRVILKQRVDPYNMTILEESDSNLVHGFEGQHVTLTCDVSSGTPKENLTWEKDDDLLAVGGPGRLIYNFTAERSDHLRNFTCYADTDDYTLNRTIQLNLILLPNVTLTALPSSTVKEGELCKLTCVSDMPNEIQNYSWNHNQAEISNFTSELVFVNTSRTQDGLYTCFASNQAGRTRASLYINVLYAPTVLNTTVTFTGQDHIRIIHCKLDGNPHLFKFANWTHSSRLDQRIREMKGFENGSLLLPRIAKYGIQFEDTGTYTCNVSNGQTDNSGKTWQTGMVNVLINGPPLFVNTVKWQHGHINTTAKISVNVTSTPELDDFEWSRNSISEISEKRFNKSCVTAIITKKMFDRNIFVKGYTCSLSITHANHRDFDKYRIQVGNAFGRSEETIMLATPGPPQQPSIISFQTEQRTVRVYWTSEFYIGCIEKVVVEYRKTLDLEWTTKYFNFNGGAIKHSFVIDGLQPSTKYTMRMFAMNKEGNSSTSDEKIFITRSLGHKETWSAPKQSGVITATVVMFGLCVIILGIWWYKHRQKAKKKPIPDYKIELQPNEELVQLPEDVDQQQEFDIQDDVNVDIIDSPPPMNLAHLSGACGVSSDVYSSIDRRKRISRDQIVTYKVANTM